MYLQIWYLNHASKNTLFGFLIKVGVLILHVSDVQQNYLLNQKRYNCDYHISKVTMNIQCWKNEIVTFLLKSLGLKKLTGQQFKFLKIVTPFSQDEATLEVYLLGERCGANVSYVLKWLWSINRCDLNTVYYSVPFTCCHLYWRRLACFSRSMRALCRCCRGWLCDVLSRAVTCSSGWRRRSARTVL